MKPEDLPEHLAERTRTLSGSATVSGELVVYWMHHAMRAMENPALDTACAAAQALGLPLLVYQGLGGRHRFDSDRHHTFILEGARDVSRALERRGLRYVFRLATRTDEPSPLYGLGARAAVVISEDLPVPPFTTWLPALAQQMPAPLWLVDTACILPMRTVRRAYARAFEFRRDQGAEQLARARQTWPASMTRVAAYTAPLDFQPVDLEGADIGELCARCPIDHTIGPAPETRGGTQAGLARWSAFKDDGLSTYSQLRNDAAIEPPRGTSRLSPYLHYGQVSPFQIAREAEAAGSRGAEKFLDELLIWRELAHNFCFHHAHLAGGLESLARLPAWARDSLLEHAADVRAHLFSWEQLARGRTGDELWDAAQRALVTQGALHNNLRMTWGKALLGWTADPQSALQMLFDLNHRFALDGSDPNSYGGLLYCLGLFDRPFTPARPVSGTVRTRATAGHAQRLDLRRYRALTHTHPAASSVAVIGGGLAGLSAARALQDLGFKVTVMERARRVGGRAAWRPEGAAGYDHGAQYFTARDPRFERYVASWRQQGLVAPWKGKIVGRAPDGALTPVASTQRFVGVPDMNAVARHLATDLEVLTAHEVSAVSRRGNQWHLSLANRTGDHQQFDSLVLAMPPGQASRLLEKSALPQGLDEVAMLPSWAVMISFRSALPTGFDGAFVNHEILDWVARDSSKPGRTEGERWILHATSRWSASRLESPPETIASTLLDNFFHIFELAPTLPASLQAHRWTYARPAASLTNGCLWKGKEALALCGDWCLGGRIEGAFLSGAAAAGRIAASAIKPAS